MARQLKRWESPRKEGRNTKGKGGSARQRQRRKQLQRRVLCLLYVCSVCTKCRLLTCNDIGTADYGYVCKAQLHRHASKCFVLVRWQVV